MTPKQIERSLRDSLGPISYDTATALAEALSEVPLDPILSGTYVCGCSWQGAIIPHFCPYHPGAFPVFEIREPRK